MRPNEVMGIVGGSGAGKSVLLRTILGLRRPQGGTVHMLARLGAPGDRHVLGQFDADVRQPAEGNRLAAIVDAYNRAASAALGKVVAESAQAIGGR